MNILVVTPFEAAILIAALDELQTNYEEAVHDGGVITTSAEYNNHLLTCMEILETVPQLKQYIMKRANISYKN